MTYLLVFFTSLITTVFFTPYFISFLEKTKIVDFPGGRKIHNKVTPRMGGLIIFLVVITMLNAFIEDFASIKFIIISLTILVFSGIVDDVLGLNNFIKFIIQNISAIILIFYIEALYTKVILFGISFSNPFDYLILLLFIIGTINSINFLDGLDGLASGFALLIFSVILALAIRKNDTFLILLSVSLLGSLLGFLRYNAFPAVVFLGDTGSLVLGFFLIIASFLTSINYHESNLDLTFPLILLAVPIIDTLKVFILRIIKKKDPFLGDTSHQHHIIYKSLVNQEIAVFIILIFSLAFVFVSLLYLIDYRIESLILFFVLALILLSIQPILIKYNMASIFNKATFTFKNFKIKNLKFIIKILLILSAVLIVSISTLSFSFKTSLSADELVFILITVTILLLIALFQYKNIKTIGHFNVYLNFAIFFIVTKLSLPSIFFDNINIDTLNSIQEIIFYLLSLVLSIALIFRWKVIMGSRFLFNGLDLTMMVFITLTFGVNKILEFDLNYYLSRSLLEAFIFYIWFKIVVDMKKSFEYNLTIFSFLLPISLISVLLLFYVI